MGEALQTLAWTVIGVFALALLWPRSGQAVRDAWARLTRGRPYQDWLDDSWDEDQLTEHEADLIKWEHELLRGGETDERTDGVS